MGSDNSGILNTTGTTNMPADNPWERIAPGRCSR